jgi:hypothetical protein
LRDLTVRNNGSGSHCAAVYLGNVAGTPMQNVTVVTDGGLVNRYGIRMAYTTNAVEIADVTVNVSGTDVWLIHATGTPSAKMVFRDLSLNPNASVNAFGVQVTDADVTIERVAVSAPPGALYREPLTALGSSVVRVRNSSLLGTGSFAAAAAVGATLRIANSLLDGTLSNVTTCIQSYDANFAPVSC